MNTKQNEQDIFKTVSAFANYQDGIIEFGINDERKVRGLQNLYAFAESLTNMLNDSIKPIPEYTVEVNETGRTVILSVKRGDRASY